VSGQSIAIIAPLVQMSKKDIVLLAHSLGVPVDDTWSCYVGGDEPCGECESCQLRAKGLHEAGVNV